MTSPLEDMAKRIYTTLDPSKEAGHKADASWHNEAVKEANESFRKSDGPKLGRRKKAKKATKRKESAKK
jgi:hypothetical protein